MKIFTPLLVALTALPIAAQAAPPVERLGKVSFSVSCSPSVRAPFNRGVALLHDFWYDEAQPQFERIAKVDPQCAMAHWGIAMSLFHEISDGPDEHSVEHGRTQMHAALAHHSETARDSATLAEPSDCLAEDTRGYN